MRLSSARNLIKDVAVKLKHQLVWNNLWLKETAFEVIHHSLCIFWNLVFFIWRFNWFAITRCVHKAPFRLPVGCSRLGNVLLPSCLSTCLRTSPWQRVYWPGVLMTRGWKGTDWNGHEKICVVDRMMKCNVAPDKWICLTHIDMYVG